MFVRANQVSHEWQCVQNTRFVLSIHSNTRGRHRRNARLHLTKYFINGLKTPNCVHTFTIYILKYREDYFFPKP